MTEAKKHLLVVTDDATLYDATGGAGYAGPLCEPAKVPPGKIYDDLDEARYHSKRLTKVADGIKFVATPWLDPKQVEADKKAFLAQVQKEAEEKKAKDLAAKELVEKSA